MNALLVLVLLAAQGDAAAPPSEPPSAASGPRADEVAAASSACAFVASLAGGAVGMVVTTALFFLGVGFESTNQLLAIPAIGLLVGGAGGAFYGATAAGVDAWSAGAIAGSAAGGAIVGTFPGVAIVAYAGATYSDGGYGSLLLVITGLLAIGGGLATGASAGAALSSYVVAPAE